MVRESASQSENLRLIPLSNHTERFVGIQFSCLPGWHLHQRNSVMRINKLASSLVTCDAHQQASKFACYVIRQGSYQEPLNVRQIDSKPNGHLLTILTELTREIYS